MPFVCTSSVVMPFVEDSVCHLLVRGMTVSRSVIYVKVFVDECGIQHLR